MATSRTTTTRTTMMSLFSLLIALGAVLVNGQGSPTAGDTSLSTDSSTSIQLTTSLSTPLSSPPSQLVSSTTSTILPSPSSSSSSPSSSSTITSSAAAPSSTTAATSSAPSSSSTVSNTPSTSTVMAAPNSTSTSTSTGTSTSTSTSTRAAPPTTTGKFVPVYADQGTAEYARVVAAVCAGCGLLLLTLVFMLVVSLLLRHTIRTERHKSSKPGKGTSGGNVGFYNAGAGSQMSHQALFSNLSGTNIVGGYSDLHLDAKDGRGVYLNRGYDSSAELNNTGTGAGSGYDSSYRPIEIRSSQDPRMSTA